MHIFLVKKTNFLIQVIVLSKNWLWSRKHVSIKNFKNYESIILLQLCKKIQENTRTTNLKNLYKNLQLILMKKEKIDILFSFNINEKIMHIMLVYIIQEKTNYFLIRIFFLNEGCNNKNKSLLEFSIIWNKKEKCTSLI